MNVRTKSSCFLLSFTYCLEKKKSSKWCFSMERFIHSYHWVSEWINISGRNAVQCLKWFWRLIFVTPFLWRSWYSVVEPRVAIFEKRRHVLRYFQSSTIGTETCRRDEAKHRHHQHLSQPSSFKHPESALNCIELSRHEVLCSHRFTPRRICFRFCSLH